ncbi:MAG: ribosome assembly RNA-binding protein YhbY [Gammaproteobacteria bacterium]
MSNVPDVLTAQQKKQLRGLAHALEPIVRVGNAGITAAVLNEVDLALGHHELIKIKITVADRSSRDAMIKSIAESSSATVITRIGNVAVLHRPQPSGSRLLVP